MPGCSVKDCFNSSVKGFKLFKLPGRSAERKQEWLNIINQSDFPIHGKICEVIIK